MAGEASVLGERIVLKDNPLDEGWENCVFVNLGRQAMGGFPVLLASDLWEHSFSSSVTGRNTCCGSCPPVGGGDFFLMGLRWGRIATRY